MQVRKIVEPKAWCVRVQEGTCKRASMQRRTPGRKWWRRFWHARVTWRVVREEIRLHSVTVVMVVDVDDGVYEFAVVDVGDDVVEFWCWLWSMKRLG